MYKIIFLTFTLKVGIMGTGMICLVQKMVEAPSCTVIQIYCHLVALQESDY